MRSPNERQWVPSTREPSAERGRSGIKLSSASFASKPQHSDAASMKREPPFQVRIRNTAPPDPELLSRIGCRCLVIDFPGVLYENISVSYVPGYVRVEGKRTVGRVKEFRKKFPLNHEQVVTRMLSAFLCQGVLVIVVPTKVAAAMAAAAIVAAQLLAKGYSPFAKPFPSRKLLLLSQDAAANLDLQEEEGPVKFSKDIRATADTSPRGVIDCRQKSAFAPYLATKSVPFEVDQKSIPFDEAAADPKMEPQLRSGSMQQRQEAHQKLDNKNLPPLHSRRHDKLNVREPEKRTSASLESPVMEVSSSSEGNQETGTKPIGQEKKGILESASSSELAPVLWSDDSLRDEPSVSATQSLRIMESVYIESIREARFYDAPQLSPILEHPYSDTSFSVDSPDNSQSNGRPLTWVQFDSAWQEKEESLMVDTAANHRRIEQLHEGRRKAEGTNVHVGVPIMLPFEDELVDRVDDHGLRMELEPHPYWRSAPFLPRLQDSAPHHLDTIDSYSSPSLAYRGSHDRHHSRKPPNPSLRRKENKVDEPTTPTPPRRKSVTWVDEI